MANLHFDKKLTFEIDSLELTPGQIRQLKTLFNLLSHVLVTEEEGEYFDGSAEAIRLCASLIKQSNFIHDMKSANIPYAEQALEYSLDILQDHISTAKVVTYDN